MPYMQPGMPVYGMPSQQAPPRYAVPSSAPQPQRPAQLTVPPPPMLAANGLKPKVRAQAPDTPAPPPRIVLPSPEALGIQVAAAAPQVAVDWNGIHARIEQLGIINLRRDRLPQGGFRVLLAMPGRQAEGNGATEAAAMQAALEHAEAMVAARR